MGDDCKDGGDDYVAWLVEMAKARGWDPRVFPSVAMSDPRCYVCQTPGPRFCCPVCPKDEVAPGVVTWRCGSCHAKHGETVHARTPETPSAKGTP